MQTTDFSRSLANYFIFLQYHISKMSSTKFLTFFRFAVGGGAWFLPLPTLKLFGLTSPPDDQEILGWRLFASREIAVGLGLVGFFSPQAAVIKAILSMGVLFDSMDAVATLVAYSRGSITSYAAALAGGGAVLAAAVGTLALKEH